MKKKCDYPSIHFVRKAFDEQKKNFSGVDIIRSVNNRAGLYGVWFYDSTILRNLRRLRNEKGRNFRCNDIGKSSYQKI